MLIGAPPTHGPQNECSGSAAAVGQCSISGGILNLDYQTTNILSKRFEEKYVRSGPKVPAPSNGAGMLGLA